MDDITFKFREDLEQDSVGTSNGFWYDLTDGGYIKAEDVLSDPEQIKQVQDAVKLLRQLHWQLEEGEYLIEF